MPFEWNFSRWVSLTNDETGHATMKRVIRKKEFYQPKVRVKCSFLKLKRIEEKKSLLVNAVSHLVTLGRQMEK